MNFISVICVALIIVVVSSVVDMWMLSSTLTFVFPIALIGIIIAALYYAVKISSECDAENEKLRNEFLDTFDAEIRKDIYKHTFLISKCHTKLGVAYLEGDREKSMVLAIPKIKSCEIVQDGSIIANNAIGRAVVGGILAGGAGAIVGSTSAKHTNKVESIELRFINNDIHNPITRVNVYQNVGLKDDIKEIINQCEELIAILNIIAEKE